MEVRAKKALGQHFLTDRRIAQAIVDALRFLDSALPGSARNDKTTAPSEGKSTKAEDPVPVISTKVEDATPVISTKAGGRVEKSKMDVLEVGPGMGVLTQYLLQREDIDLKLVEIDGESVEYLLTHFAGMQGKLLQADFLHLPLERVFPGRFAVIGNFPYNISSQIFFKILDYREQIPQVVCMIQKEVAERIAEGPGSKTYGILSVLLQAWYDIEYLFGVGPGCFAPPPKVDSAVIRLTRNGRTSLGCDESLFKAVVKTAFGQRRKTLRNSLKPIILEKAERLGWDTAEFLGNASGQTAEAPELELMLLEDDGRIDRKKGKKRQETNRPEPAICTVQATSLAELLTDPVFERRPETLSVEDFIALTNFLA